MVSCALILKCRVSVCPEQCFIASIVTSRTDSFLKTISPAVSEWVIQLVFLPEPHVASPRPHPPPPRRTRLRNSDLIYQSGTSYQRWAFKYTFPASVIRGAKTLWWFTRRPGRMMNVLPLWDGTSLLFWKGIYLYVDISTLFVNAPFTILHSATNVHAYRS